jgi:hypothetical protein
MSSSSSGEYNKFIGKVVPKAISEKINEKGKISLERMKKTTLKNALRMMSRNKVKKIRKSKKKKKKQAGGAVYKVVIIQKPRKKE